MIASVASACGSSSVSVVDTDAAAVTPSGFDSITVRLTEPDGAVCERCLFLARSAEDRARGLMGVTGLGDHDGMAFVYDEPHEGKFWMKDTLMPLSIGFYDTAGSRLAAFDMDPCTSADCPAWGPEAPFVMAVETEQGRLEELGFTETARLEVVAEDCRDPLRTG